jgi:hypothetical protein
MKRFQRGSGRLLRGLNVLLPPKHAAQKSVSTDMA